MNGRPPEPPGVRFLGSTVPRTLGTSATLAVARPASALAAAARPAASATSAITGS